MGINAEYMGRTQAIISIDGGVNNTHHGGPPQSPDRP